MERSSPESCIGEDRAKLTRGRFRSKSEHSHNCAVASGLQNQHLHRSDPVDIASCTQNIFSVRQFGTYVPCCHEICDFRPADRHGRSFLVVHSSSRRYLIHARNSLARVTIKGALLYLRRRLRHYTLEQIRPDCAVTLSFAPLSSAFARLIPLATTDGLSQGRGPFEKTGDLEHCPEGIPP